MGFLKRLVSVLAAGFGFFAVYKYLHDYTEFKAAKEEDLDELKAGTEKAKEAAKRTYVAIKESTDVTPSAEALGKAVAQVAGSAGKVLQTVAPNTASFVRAEKEKYMEDPEAYKQQVSRNLKSMTGEAAELFESLKDDAEGRLGSKAVRKEDFPADVSDPAEDFKEVQADAPCGVEQEAVADGQADSDVTLKETGSDETASEEASPEGTASEAEDNISDGAEFREEPEILVTDDPRI